MAAVLAFALTGAQARAQVVTWSPGGWSWFGDPRAVHVGGPSGRTFVGWVDWSGNVAIGAYDPQAQLLTTDVVGRVFSDDHDAPLNRCRNRSAPHRLLVGAQRQRHELPHDGPIGRCQREDPAAAGASGHPRIRRVHYPNPVRLSAKRDRLYLLWRGADWSADFATREPEGAWKPAKELIRFPGERPYVKVAHNGSDTIALAFTNGHPRNVLTSVYYAAYRHGLYGRPATRDHPARRRAYHPTQGGRGVRRRQDAGLGLGLGRCSRPAAAGDPYATFPSHTQHVHWYASFDGRRWVSHRVATAAGSISPSTIEYEYSDGIALDHSNSEK